MEEIDALEGMSLKAALEALLFVSSEAVSTSVLAEQLRRENADVKRALQELSEEYVQENRGFQLREVAGGWRYFTHPAYHDMVEEYVLSWDSRNLSQAALETLSVIAYHQPVTREGVRAIRGVNSEAVISSLKEKGLVRELGRDPKHGQAIIYGTTAQFLEHFGLKSLKDLPPLEDFAPDEESKNFIRERLGAGSLSSALSETATELDEDYSLVEGYVEDDELASIDESYDEDDELETILDDSESGFGD